MTTEELRGLAAAEAFLPAWLDFYHECAPANPFLHPIQQTAWAKNVLSDGADIRLVRVIDRDGDLVAVAPFYVERWPYLPYPRITRAAPIGMGKVPLIELPQALVRPGSDREALHEIVQHFIRNWPDVDWAVLTLPSGQWLRADWTDPANSRTLFVDTTVSVVMDLPDDVSVFQQRLSRNLKESLRRARNRLRRDNLQWTVVCEQSAGNVASALTLVAELHRARAQSVRGSYVHPDRLRTPGLLPHLADMLPPLAEDGGAAIYLLYVDQSPAAAALVFFSPNSVYLSHTGFDPRWWDHNVMTLLTASVLEDAIRRGYSQVNFSVTAPISKLRWSGCLPTNHTFGVSRVGFKGGVGLGTYFLRRHARRLHQLVSR